MARGAAPCKANALREFDALTDGLQRAGVQRDRRGGYAKRRPNRMRSFPNNWVSFHRDGTVVLYPMLAPNRRLERRDEVIQRGRRRRSFRITRTVDLSHREERGQYLEGTGSLVLDRPRRVAYANLSPRTDLDALGEFAQQLDYELVTFEAFDAAGNPVYHTNVMMAIGAQLRGGVRRVDRRDRGIAMPCTRRCAPAGAKSSRSLSRQMHAFAGNVLELAPARLETSSRCRPPRGEASMPRSGATLEKHGRRAWPPTFPSSSAIGGGGVRCMLAEMHLPPRL